MKKERGALTKRTSAASSSLRMIKGLGSRRKSSAAGEPLSSDARPPLTPASPPPQLEPEADNKRVLNSNYSSSESILSDNSGEVWYGTEQEIMTNMEKQVFSTRNETIVFLCKLLKPKPGPKEGTSSKQLLIVSTSKANGMKTGKSYQRTKPPTPELMFNVISVNSLKNKLRIPLRMLRVIDGNPELAFDASKDAPLKIKLEFHDELHNQRRERIAGTAATRFEKLLLTASLMRLCEAFPNMRPTARNISFSELRVVAGEEQFLQRCPLLKEAPPSHGLSIFGGRLATAPSSQIEDVDSSDDDAALDSAEQARGSVDRKSSDDNGRLGASDNDNDNDNGHDILAAVDKDSERRQNISVEGLLERREQEELWEILNMEGIEDSSAERLAKELDAQITTLEDETTETLRQWENNASSGSAAAVDPVALLVQQLEQVYSELNDMDSWLSYDNSQVLRAMRKDIQKIELENNRLRVESQNRTTLRKHITELFKRNTISKESTIVVRDLTSILQEDALLEVERGRAPHGDNAAAIRRLCNCARELAGASKGLLGRSSRSKSGETRALDFPEEPHLSSVKALRSEVNSSVETYCKYVQVYLINRFKAQNVAYEDLFNKINPPATSTAATDSFESGTGSSKSATHINVPSFPRGNKVKRLFMPYGELVETLLLKTGAIDPVLTDYAQSMGDTYSRMLTTFFCHILDVQTPDQDDDGFFFRDFANSASGKTGDVALAEELARANALAISIVSDEQYAGAVLLRHCLQELVPVTLDEQKFLKTLFFWDDAESDHASKSYATTSPSADSKQGKSQALELGATEKLQRTMDFFFRKATGFLESLTPTRSLAQAVLCTVDIECAIIEVGDVCSYWEVVLGKFKARLVEFFEKFADRQLPWMEANLVTSFARFPCFVDKVAALWDRATESAQERPLVVNKHSSSTPSSNVKEFLECFKTNSTKFAENAVGLMLSRIADGLFTFVDQCKSPAIQLQCAHIYTSTMSGRGGAALSDQHLERAAKVLEAAKIASVEQLLDQSLPELQAFVRQIDELLKEVPIEEVPFHKTRIELGRILQSISLSGFEAALLDADESAAQIFAGGGTADTIPNSGPNFIELELLLRKAIRNKVHALYQRYIWIVENCYGDLVRPTLEELERVL